MLRSELINDLLELTARAAKLELPSAIAIAARAAKSKQHNVGSRELF